MTTLRQRLRNDDGLISTELAIVMVTFLAGFLLLVVFAGRVSQAENDVRSAAHEAARAATLEANPSQADAAARQVASSNLAASGLSCTGGAITNVDTSNFVPDGTVTVTIICNASFSNLTSLKLPGNRQFRATAVEIIDTYRSD